MTSGGTIAIIQPRRPRDARRRPSTAPGTAVASVVHVVEAYGGGVAAAVSDYVADAPGHRHALLYADRSEALVRPAAGDDFVWRRPMRDGHVRRLRDLRTLMRSAEDGTMFHAHSSLAGVYVRVASLGLRRLRTAYTPHCYGFERRDLSRPVLGALYAVEKALALASPGTIIAACSPRELQLASRLRRGSPGVLVPNIAPTSGGARPLRRPVRGRPVVTGAGRLSPQKDPGYFLDCVLALRASGVEVTARWLGDGDPDVRRDLESAGVVVTGWLDRAELTRELGEADLYLHSGLWEGFPITILEALTAGTPVLVRDIAAMHGYGFPVLLGAPHEVVRALDDLVDDDAIWADTVRQAATMLEECSREHQVEALRELYG